MKNLSRDIVITLIVKFTLLTILWWVCFRHVEKPHYDQQQWLFGSTYSADLNKKI